MILTRKEGANRTQHLTKQVNTFAITPGSTTDLGETTDILRRGREGQREISIIISMCADSYTSHLKVTSPQLYPDYNKLAL